MQESRVRIGLTIMAILVVAFALSIGDRQATAQSAKNVLKVAPGSSVSVQGKTVTMRTGPGATGTWSCSCGVFGSGGSCTVGQSGGTISCYKGTGDTCKSECIFSSTTTGIGGGAAARSGGVARPGVAAPR